MAKQNEIEYFSLLGEEGRRHAEKKPFSDSDRGDLLIEIGQIMNLLPPPPLHLLDVGCGTGWTSEFLARAGYIVTGMDISPEMIESARRIRSPENLNFVVADFEQMTHLGLFDVILSFGALHHSENLDAALDGCYGCLKPGAMLVLMEPGEGHEDAETSRQYVAEYGLTERSLPPAFMVGALRSHGFSDIETIPRLSLLKQTGAFDKNWKMAAARFVLGEKLARILQWFFHSRKVALVTARRLR